MKIKRMIGDKVLFEPIEAKKVTKGGLALPDGYQADGARRARVVDVGPGRRTLKDQRVPPILQAGQVAILAPHRRLMEVEIEGKNYLVGRESDVLAVEE